MSTGCTWFGCCAAAAYPQIAKDGVMWANLCEEHNAAIDRAIVAGDPKSILGTWVKAGGGAKKMAARMVK